MVLETKIQEKLESEDIDMLVATTPDNVFYTAGLKIFTQWDGLSSEAYSVWTVDHGGPFLVYPRINTGQVRLSGVDFAGLASVHHNFLLKSEDTCGMAEEIYQLNQDIANFDTVLEGLIHTLEPIVSGGETVSIEMVGMTPADLDAVTEAIDVEVVPGDGILAELRMIKTDDEVRRLRRAAEITDDAIREAVEHLELGMTEREFARIIQRNMIDRGATKIAHQHVAFGARGVHLGMVPYPEYGGASPGVLEEGDIIQIDTGCYFEGYISDLARTYSYRSASDDLEAKYELVRATNDETISLLAAGGTNAEIYESCSRFIKQLGEERGIATVAAADGPGLGIDLFGHGLGLRVFEFPPIVPATDDFPAVPITEGMVMSVESPYKEVGTGLVASEDTVVLGPDGPERFTTAPETLPIIE